MQHKDVKAGNIHEIHDHEFNTIAERDKYIPNAKDLNKICLVNVPYGFYALKSIEPIEWKQLGGVEASGNGVDGYTKDEANQLFMSEEEVNTIVDQKNANKLESYNISATEYKCGYSRNGKEVFGIEVDCGALPNATAKTIAIPNYNPLNKYWISLGESYTMPADKSSTMPLPYVPVNANLANNNAWVTVYLQSGSIKIQTYGNLTAYTETKIVLNYTKG